MRFPLEVQLKPSLSLRAILVGFHALTALVFVRVAWKSLPILVTAALLLALAVSAFLSERAERKKSGLGLILGEDGLLTVAPGVAESAGMEAGCADFGWAIWLHWGASPITAETASCRGSLMLVADNLPPGAWRKLRIWLRHSASVGAPVS